MSPTPRFSVGGTAGVQGVGDDGQPFRSEDALSDLILQLDDGQAVLANQAASAPALLKHGHDCMTDLRSLLVTPTYSSADDSAKDTAP